MRLAIPIAVLIFSIVMLVISIVDVFSVIKEDKNKKEDEEETNEELKDIVTGVAIFFYIFSHNDLWSLTNSHY